MHKTLVPLTLLVFSLVSLTSTAPAVCRSCTKNCFQNANITSSNSTDTDDLLAELESNRIKRDVDGMDGVEFRACSRFQIEMLLIPLAIAMIPLVLSALILCTCCCGPKDSRGKLPEDFLSNITMSKKRRLSSEEMELEFCDGYVQRKDSARTKFSTVVSYIEARRESLWSVKTDNNDTTDMMTSSEASPVTTESSMTSSSESSKVPRQESVDSVASSVPERLRKVASTDSMKKTRFSDTVSVISVESLGRR